MIATCFEGEKKDGRGKGKAFGLRLKKRCKISLMPGQHRKGKKAVYVVRGERGGFCGAEKGFSRSPPKVVKGKKGEGPSLSVLLESALG